MIKLNEQYSINNGQGSIVFTEGNKGTVNALYTIAGNKSEGKINGTLDGNVLKGTFHVDASAGLIEFTFTENGFEAKWKQGIEPGPMRGKWSGNLTSNTIQNNDLDFTNMSLYKFSGILDNLKGDEKLEDEFYSKLNLKIKENPEYAYLGLVTENLTLADGFESSFYFENKSSFFENYAIDFNDLDENLVKIVLNKSGISSNSIIEYGDDYNQFINLLSTYFCFSIFNVIDNADEEVLAEFICSVSTSFIDDFEDEDNFILDQVIDLLKFAFSIDVQDFEGDCSIYPNRLLDYAIECGHDYISIARELISENA